MIRTRSVLPTHHKCLFHTFDDNDAPSVVVVVAIVMMVVLRGDGCPVDDDHEIHYTNTSTKESLQPTGGI